MQKLMQGLVLNKTLVGLKVTEKVSSSTGHTGVLKDSTLIGISLSDGWK